MSSRLLFSTMFSALVAALLSSCGTESITPPEPEITLRLQGTVRDEAARSPVANANVAVRAAFTMASARTDAEGRYALTVPLGSVRPDCTFQTGQARYRLILSVEAEGYAPWSSDSSGGPYPFCTPGVQTLDVYLRK